MKSKQAISLIVLVITVLVLSILAATVIITLSNTNIISQAQSAVNKTEAQQIEEMKSLMYAEGILGNNPEPITIGSITLVWNEEKKEVRATHDGVVIPTGFYYVGGTKDTGLIISDDPADESKGESYNCIGNQFVWIPVEYTIEENEVPDETTGLYESFTNVFRRGTLEENPAGSGIYKMTGKLGTTEVTEPHKNSFDTNGKEYYSMCRSVQEYHGFYIGRFEAGDGDATDGTNEVKKEPRTGVTEAHRVVSKKGAYVYNYVPWGETISKIEPFTLNGVENVAGAVYLSQGMYIDHVSVVSTLCYGVQWHAILNFVSDKDHDISNSVLWGNYRYSDGDAKENSGPDKMDFTTGRSEAWKAKNIYDLAGNMNEWGMSIWRSGVPQMAGGCAMYSLNSTSAASSEWGDIGAGTVYPYYGFRVALYLK